MNQRPDEIVDCICFWCDMLGYGAPFIESGWNLRDERCQRNFERLDRMHLSFTITLAVELQGTKLSFNDGFAHTMDCNPTTEREYRGVLHFLEGIIHDYDHMTGEDEWRGFPGLRGVISCGHRYSGNRVDLSQVVGPGGKIFAYSPHVFQMNTAFSKAYLIESSGSRANLKGPALYIDVDVLHMLESYAEKLGIQKPTVESEEDGKLLVTCYGGPSKEDWFASIRVDETHFPYGESARYNNRGIETTLFRYERDSVDSIVDAFDALNTFEWSKYYARLEAEDE